MDVDDVNIDDTFTTLFDLDEDFFFFPPFIVSSILLSPISNVKNPSMLISSGTLTELFNLTFPII